MDVKMFGELLSGMAITLKLFSFTLLFSLPLGMLVGEILRRRIFGLTFFLKSYILLMRGTPLLLQLIFIYYGLPFLGIVLDRFPSALVAFALNYGAYFAEIFRGGFQTIPKGQYEAAYLLQLSKGQTLRKIILPQVVKITLPSVGNEVINLVKDTSLIYILGLSDVMRKGKVIMERQASLLPLIGVGVLYLVLTGILTFLLHQGEKTVAYEK